MLIPWSGGIDSTMVLWDALKYWHGDRRTQWKIDMGDFFNEYNINETDHEPRAMTVRCPQAGVAQQALEVVSREKISKVFNRMKWSFEHGVIELDPPQNLPYKGIFAQPLLWLTQAALVVRDGEPLIMGWIRTDDATSRLNMFRDLWRQLTESNGKRSQLLVPFRYSRKQDMIKLAKSRGVLKKCWYCEEPAGKRPCKRCDSCKAMIAAQAVVDSERK